jgi:VanZ family protein
MKTENKIVDFFREQKVVLHLVLGMLFFIPIVFVFDFSSLRWFEVLPVALIIGCILGSVFEWFQMYFSGRKSNNEVILFLSKYHIIKNNKKTRFCKMDALITGVGFTVLAMISFFI